MTLSAPLRRRRASAATTALFHPDCRSQPPTPSTVRCLRPTRLDADGILEQHSHGVLILDVRSPETFARGHLAASVSIGPHVGPHRRRRASSRERVHGHTEGSAHIPLDQLPAEANELDPDKPIAVYYAGEYRSSIVASLLRRRGFYGCPISGG
jgi:rhodanese-related sulfurtransferase